MNFVVLLAVFLGLLATGRGLQAADCDSTPEGLLQLEDVQYLTDSSTPEDQPVVLKGILKYFFSPQNFIIEVRSLSVSMYPCEAIKSLEPRKH